ncbi:MAG: response regulator [Spirochaetales bacterium]|nr:response regulator [Spirochaetales bacterium]
MSNILIVDDSSSMRKMINFTLTEAGYQISEADDGTKGLEQVHTNSYDCIITDINMPTMDGITFIKNLRTLQQYRFTPVIVLTTEDEEDTKQKGIQAGATAWIVKPFTPDDLLATVRKVLR